MASRTGCALALVIVGALGCANSKGEYGLVLGSAVVCTGACEVELTDGRPTKVATTDGRIAASGGLTPDGASVFRTIARVTGAVLIANIVADAWEAITKIGADESVAKDAIDASVIEEDQVLDPDLVEVLYPMGF